MSAPKHLPPGGNDTEGRKCALSFAGIALLTAVLGMFAAIKCGLNDAHAGEKPQYWIDTVCRNGMYVVVAVSETGDIDVEPDMVPSDSMVPVRAAWCNEKGERTDQKGNRVDERGKKLPK
ncbi:MAG: hypothetical protein ACRD3R_06855 [Terriglobales bacterium]